MDSMFGLEKSPEDLINVCAEKRERMSLSVVILKLSVHHYFYNLQIFKVHETCLSTGS